MEYPSKRLKLSSNSSRSKYTYFFPSTRKGEGSAPTSEDSRFDVRRDSHEGIKKHHHAHMKFHDRSQRPRAHQRDIHVEPRSDATTVIATATVVDVIIQDGTTQVAALTVPNVPTVLTVGTAKVTIGAATETIQLGSTPTPSASSVASTQTTFSNTSSHSSSVFSATTQTSNSTTATVTSTSTMHSNSTITSTLSTPITIIIDNSTSTISTASSSTTSSSKSTSSLTASSDTISKSSTSTSRTASSSASSSAAASSATAAGAGTGSGSGSGSGSSSNSGSGSGTGPTPKIVGSVVGAVAGFALILLVLLWLLRKHRKRLEGQQALPSDPATTSGTTAERTSQTSGATPFAAAIAPALLGRWRQSGQSGQSDAAATSSEAAPSEQGFQKLGGRKVTGVLSGGDPYGGNYGAFEKDTHGGPPASDQREGTLSDQSFYRDSQGFYGGRGGDPTSPTTPIPTFAGGTSADHDFAEGHQNPHEGLPVMRPSPARTPVRASPSIASLPRTPGSNPPSAARLQGQDGVGRTLSVHDGSRGSRFTESV